MPLSNGVNELSIQEVDYFGNISEAKIITVDAFNPEGWKILSCQKLQVPLNANKLQAGYLIQKATDPEMAKWLKTFGKDCNKVEDRYNSLKLDIKGTYFPCTGGCDAYVDYLSISVSTDKLEARKAELTKTQKDEPSCEFCPSSSSKGTAKAYTTKAESKDT